MCVCVCVCVCVRGGGYACPHATCLLGNIADFSVNIISETRLNKFYVLVGDKLPAHNINFSDYQQCAYHDANFDAGTTRHMICERPVEGNYVIIAIPSPSQFLTLCEVAVFGYRGGCLVCVCAFMVIEGLPNRGCKSRSETIVTRSKAVTGNDLWRA